MKRVGLYFGTFNPIHIGHLHIANLASKELDEVWFVLTRLNPFKRDSDIVTYEHREEMIRYALTAFKNDKLKICIEEKFLSIPNYTHCTLKSLQKTFPNYEFYLIIGDDVIRGFKSWKEWEWIIDNFDLIVYQRNERIEEIGDFCLKNFTKKQFSNIILTQKGFDMNISSSYIRNAIKEGLNISYLLSKKVYKYITKNKLYNG